MKCSDIRAEPILRFLADNRPQTATWWNISPTVAEAMPSGTPGKLVLAKMKKLVKAGLVAGCSCGCRGDFAITERGLDVLSGFKREG